MADLEFRRLLHDYHATRDSEIGARMVHMGQRFGFSLADYRDMGIDWDILVNNLRPLDDPRWSWTGIYGRLAMAAYCGVTAAQALVGGRKAWDVNFSDARWLYVLRAHAEDWPEELDEVISSVDEGASREEMQEALIMWALGEEL